MRDPESWRSGSRLKTSDTGLRRVGCTEFAANVGIRLRHDGGDMHKGATALRGARYGLASVILSASVSAQTPAPKPAVPVDPIPAILDAFRSHEIVALGDAHGTAQAQEFLRRLVRDPRFVATVDDIIVEFGNARYQGIVDRFVTGADVPLDSLRQVWRNTTVANEIPVDEELFTTVRAINATQRAGRQLRILLGDPPIDWAEVRNRADHFRWLAMRDSYAAALIQVEVLARGRRALLVYGQLHFQRLNVMSNLEMNDWRMQTIVSLLERATPTRVFTVWNADDGLAAVQPDVASWRAPSLAVLRGTTLGAADATVFVPTPARFTFRGDTRVEVPRDQWRSLRAEEQLDAVLYLGPRSALRQVPLSAAICSDRRFVEERLRRIELTGIPPAEADRVKQLCAGGAPKG